MSFHYLIINFNHLFFSLCYNWLAGNHYRLLYISSVDYGNATVDSYKFFKTNFIGYDKAISRLQETTVLQ